MFLCYFTTATHLVPSPIDPRTSGPPLPVPLDKWSPKIRSPWTDGPQPIWSLWTNGPRKFGPPGQTVPNQFGPRTSGPQTSGPKKYGPSGQTVHKTGFTSFLLLHFAATAFSRVIFCQFYTFVLLHKHLVI